MRVASILRCACRDTRPDARGDDRRPAGWTLAHRKRLVQHGTGGGRRRGVQVAQGSAPKSARTVTPRLAKVHLKVESR